MNAYNPQLLLAYKANIDVQMVGSVFGAVEYVVSYICKEETHELMSLMSVFQNFQKVCRSDGA